ncbi:MAG TPA: hypothetical protein EYG03_17210 [Planctomycetes bacterium]|nr:hypothetical protein [Fuerstiella sp.]HIK93691.1 hypothetical protein [Planctomycetota bacterium]
MISKRPRVIKNTARAAAGGVIVVAALLALMFFQGAGSGTGEGDSSNPSLSMVTTESSADAAENSTDADLADGGLTADEQKALSDQVLSILIDEHEYLMEIPDDDAIIYRPAEIERLVELARQAEGDSNGIRVRILQRESARPSAEEKLKLALATAGIDIDALYQQSEFIP